MQIGWGSSLRASYFYWSWSTTIGPYLLWDSQYHILKKDQKTNIFQTSCFIESSTTKGFIWDYFFGRRIIDSYFDCHMTVWRFYYCPLEPKWNRRERFSIDFAELIKSSKSGRVDFHWRHRRTTMDCCRLYYKSRPVAFIGSWYKSKTHSLNLQDLKLSF
jgi:hypothetical protein